MRRMAMRAVRVEPSASSMPSSTSIDELSVPAEMAPIMAMMASASDDLDERQSAT